MRLIISATNRKGSYSLKISKIVKQIYQDLGEPCDLLDLQTIPFDSVLDEPYPKVLPEKMKKAADQVEMASSLVIVCPEYNGSLPGIFKFFLDHWHFPNSFKCKSVCFIGIGGRFGGLRPVEHLENVFTYRNSFVLPTKVFISNIQNIVEKDELKDQKVLSLLKTQAKNFILFSKALKNITFD